MQAKREGKKYQIWIEAKQEGRSEQYDTSYWGNGLYRYYYWWRGSGRITDLTTKTQHFFTFSTGESRKNDIDLSYGLFKCYNRKERYSDDDHNIETRLVNPDEFTPEMFDYIAEKTIEAIEKKEQTSPVANLGGLPSIEYKLAIERGWLAEPSGQYRLAAV